MPKRGLHKRNGKRDLNIILYLKHFEKSRCFFYIKKEGVKMKCPYAVNRQTTTQCMIEHNEEGQ